MTKPLTTAEKNSRLMDRLAKGDTKGVARKVTEATRTGIRDACFTFSILPPEKVTDDMLDRDMGERLRIIYEIEPDSPGAQWAPLDARGMQSYCTGSRYQVPIARVLTPRCVKDIDELRTYRQDVLSVMARNAIMDGGDTIDRKFIEVCDHICTDTYRNRPNNPNRFTDKIQWISRRGGLTKDNLVEGRKMLPRASRSDHRKYVLRNHIMLMNSVTACDLLKLSRGEIGDGLFEKWNALGVQSGDVLMGAQLLITSKSWLVPENRVYFFPRPEFLGHCDYLTPWTTFVEQKGYSVEWFSWWMGGFAFGNVAGVCRLDLNK